MAGRSLEQDKNVRGGNRIDNGRSKGESAQVRFGLMLRRILGEQGLSINSTGERMEMEHASWYQILSGKRKMTERQFEAFRRIVTLPEEERRELETAFRMHRLDPGGQEAFTLTRKLVRSVAEADLGITPAASVLAPAALTDGQRFHSKGAVAQALTGLILRESARAGSAGAEGGGRKLRFFLSPELIHALWENRLLIASALQGRNGQGEGTDGQSKAMDGQDERTDGRSEGTEKVSLQFLVSVPAEEEDAAGEYSVMLDLLPLVLTCGGAAEVRYFFDGAHFGNALGLVYPFYAITPEGVLLIDRDSAGGVFLADGEVRALWRESFARNFSEAQDLVRRYTSLQVLERDFPKVKGESWTILSPFPAMVMVADHELIQQFVPREEQAFLEAYCAPWQDGSARCLIPAGSLLQIQQELGYVEAGMDIHAPAKVVRKVLDRICRELGSRFFLVNPDVLSLPEKWMIKVISGRGILIFRQAQVGDVVLITERGLVRAVTQMLGDHPEYFSLERKTARRRMKDLLD